MSSLGAETRGALVGCAVSQLMMGVEQVLVSGQGTLCRPTSGRAWPGCAEKAG